MSHVLKKTKPPGSSELVTERTIYLNCFGHKFEADVQVTNLYRSLYTGVLPFSQLNWSHATCFPWKLPFSTARRLSGGPRCHGWAVAVPFGQEACRLPKEVGTIHVYARLSDLMCL